MAKITLEIKDDNGFVIKTLIHEMGSSLNHIDLIEASVEQFRLSALPEISLALLLVDQAALKKNGFPSERKLSNKYKDLAR